MFFKKTGNMTQVPGAVMHLTELTTLPNRGLLFPGFRVEFLLPFGFCPPKVGTVVCGSFIQGEVCAEFLFACCLFVFPLMGKAE